MFDMTLNSVKYLWQEIKEAVHGVACEDRYRKRPEDESIQPLTSLCIYYLFGVRVRGHHGTCVEVKGECGGFQGLNSGEASTFTCQDALLSCWLHLGMTCKFFFP